MSALTPEEKVKIRHHLGYLNVQEAQTFVLGTPAGVETQFIIEGAMNKVLQEAIPEVRRHIQILDQIESHMLCDLDNVQVTQLGDLRLNSTGKDSAQRQYAQRYNFWRQSLANLLGAYANPFDKRNGSAPGTEWGGVGGSGLNVRVNN